MTKEDWDNLKYLSELDIQHNLSPIGKDNYHTLIEQTRQIDEHPEEWDGPCVCKLCMSYADC